MKPEESIPPSAPPAPAPAVAPPSEPYLQAVFEASPLGMAILDLEGRVIHCNEAFLSLLAETRDGLGATSMLERVHPDDGAEARRQLEDLGAARRAFVQLERRLFRADGSLVWARGTASRLPAVDGRPPMLFAMLEDISTAKEAERELAARRGTLEAANATLRQQAARIEAEVLHRTQEAEAANDQLSNQAMELAHQRNFMESLIMHLPQVLVYLDTRLVMRRINPEFTRIFGRHAADVIGRSVYQLNPEFRDQVLPILVRVLTDLAPQVIRDLVLPTFAGAAKTACFDLHVVPVFDHDDRLTGVLLLGVDVSARARYEALQRAQIETLRESDAMKTQFINTLSHEFKTPLTIVTGAAELLSEGVLGPLLPAQRDYLGKIRGAAKSLLHLVSDLLDMSQIQAGKLTLVRRSTDLAETVRNAAMLLSALATRKHLSLRLDLPADLPRVHADEQRLTQVVMNLVGNAIKFTPEGGSISLALRHEGAHVICGVRDTGVGIAEEDLPRLFDSFVQLKAGMHAGGTGLGLGISKALIEAHGGEIGVSSEAGVGSYFWFSVPLGAESPDPSR